MTIQLILSIVTVALLIFAAVLLLTGKKKQTAESVADLLKKNSEELRGSVAKQIGDGTTEQFKLFREIQESVQTTLRGSREEISKRISEFQTQIDTRLSAIQQSGAESNERISASVNKTLQESRSEINKQLIDFQERLDNRLSSVQRANSENIEKVNSTLESKVKSLQESNEKRLEQMQGIVDEKLQKTLDTRLAQSFEIVGRQLESVQQGLGEMKNLAADAKSLRNALTNVKERGTYGEVRLEKLLSDILAPNQYETNAEINDNKRVEFAIKLPGNGTAPLLLPIDSKFPIEDYNRLLDAEDKQTIDETRKSLAQKLRAFAKDIHDKYIVPPKTTDFALMFLPTEGLYAEVVQNAALFEELRDKYKVTAVGATTLSAFLSSLLMGFKTLAIEQRAQEVWDTLRSVKSEFIKFEGVLDKAHKQIRLADDTLEEIRSTRTKAINRKLRKVEELSAESEQDNALLLQAAETGSVEC